MAGVAVAVGRASAWLCAAWAAASSLLSWRLVAHRLRTMASRATTAAVVGFYDRATGVRLPTATGDTASLPPLRLTSDE